MPVKVYFCQSPGGDGIVEERRETGERGGQGGEASSSPLREGQQCDLWLPLGEEQQLLTVS